MDGKKVYSIQINGVKESTDAVLALNKMLNELETRMQALEKNNIKISGGDSNTSGLKEQVALQKELNQLKKEEAAQQRLAADAYANTMKGMKQNLADLKTVINATDLGETDSIKNMTKDAGELTKKLKEMEEAYGQFGRNVGNYKSAADGFKKLTLEVNGVSRSFDNARQALKTLKNERDTLALSGGRATEQFKELDETVKQLQSDIQDMSKSSAAMDNLLDTMESFAAIGTISTGFASIFGIDDAKIEQSIKKMLAFQNVLKGIETINKQIQTREGIGAWIAPFNNQITAATTKLLAFNTALLGTGKAAKVAAVGIKAFGTALKAIGIGLAIAAISMAIEKVMDLIESFNKLSAAEQLQKDAEEAMADAYGKGMAKLTQYKSRLDSFNGSKKEEKKLVEELNKEFGDTLGTYKSIAEWQDVLDKKGKAYIETLKLQAKAQAALNAVTAAYANLMKVQMGIANGEYSGIWNSIFGKSAQAALAEAQKMVDDTSKVLEDVTKEQEKFNKENKLGDYAPQIKKNAAKTKNAMEEAQKTLNQLELRLMREGLNKKLRQLDEEERQTINKLKENGRKSAEEIRKVQKMYSAIRAKEIGEYLKSLEVQIKQSADNIKNIQFQINIKDIELQIDELKNVVTDRLEDVPTIGTFATRLDLQKIIGNLDLDKLKNASIFSVLKDDEEEIDTYYKFLEDYLSEKNDIIKEEFERLKEEIGEDNAFKVLGEKFEEEYRKELNVVRSQDLGLLDITKESLKNGEEILAQSFQARINMAAAYYNMTIEELKENLEKQGELNEQKIKEQTEQQKDAESERYSIQMSGLTKTRQDVDAALKAIEERYKVSGLEGIETIKETNEEEYKLYHETFAKGVEVDAQIQDAKKQHKTKMLQITKDGNNAIKKNELDTLKEIQNAQQKFYDHQISNYRDMQSKLNSEISKNPVQNSWGIINISQTKKNYAEILNASKTALDAIKDDRKKLESDFKNGLIGTDAYNATKNQLNDLETEINEGMRVTSEASKQLVGEFISSINQYFQVLGQSVQQIMQAVWDYQDYQFDKEQDELDKWNEELDKALDKQEDIIEEHKNNIDSIEDELATARGDRRQHLIDQLNAEISAERAAQKEKQRIEKEQEQAKKREEALEKKRREAEYKRNVMQAFVSWHLSIANGLATQPFLPVGIAMGALATTLGAVQYALVKSQKPYAKGGQLDGGVAQGKRHRDGGIPVLGGRASIEGGEFITNRQTTANNVDLLEFVNSKHRKLNIDDFIDFYSSGKAKKNIISMSPRTKFADGGQIPTLDNTYSFDDRLLEAFEKYADRPSVVSVVDINNKQDDVKRVQALAGLNV
jgi:hypothetical protein